MNIFNRRSGTNVNLKKFLLGIAIMPCLSAISLGVVLLPTLSAIAHEGHSSHAGTLTTPATPFIASSEYSFAELMDQAMLIMDQGMRIAPMNGDPDQDFVSMMIPHHQGAVDMAKALLLSGKDLEMRNLALAIIAEQQNEINLMKAWQQRQTMHSPGSHESVKPYPKGDLK